MSEQHQKLILPRGADLEIGESLAEKRKAGMDSVGPPTMIGLTSGKNVMTSVCALKHAKKHDAMRPSVVDSLTCKTTATTPKKLTKGQKNKLKERAWLEKNFPNLSHTPEDIDNPQASLSVEQWWKSLPTEQSKLNSVITKMYQSSDELRRDSSTFRSITTNFGHMVMHRCHSDDFVNGGSIRGSVNCDRNTIIFTLPGVNKCLSCNKLTYVSIPYSYRVLVNENVQESWRGFGGYTELWYSPGSFACTVALTPTFEKTEFRPATGLSATVEDMIQCTPLTKNSLNCQTYPVTHVIKHSEMMGAILELGVTLSSMSWTFSAGLPYAVWMCQDLFVQCGWETVFLAAHLAGVDPLIGGPADRVVWIYDRWGARRMDPTRLAIQNVESVRDKLLSYAERVVSTGIPDHGNPQYKRFVQGNHLKPTITGSLKHPISMSSMVMEWIKPSSWSRLLRCDPCPSIYRFLNGIKTVMYNHGIVSSQVRRLEVTLKAMEKLFPQRPGHIIPTLDIRTFRCIFELSRAMSQPLGRRLRRLWLRMVSEVVYYHVVDAGWASASELARLSQIRLGSSSVGSDQRRRFRTSGTQDFYRMFGHTDGLSGRAGRSPTPHYETLPVWLKTLIAREICKVRNACRLVFGGVAPFVGRRRGVDRVNTLKHLVCACKRSCPCSSTCVVRRLARAVISVESAAEHIKRARSEQMTRAGYSISGTTNINDKQQPLSGWRLGSLSLDTVLTEEYRYIKLGNHTMHCLCGNIVSCTFAYYAYLGLLGCVVRDSTMPDGSGFSAVSFAKADSGYEYSLVLVDHQSETTVTLPFGYGPNRTLVMEYDAGMQELGLDQIRRVWEDFGVYMPISLVPCQLTDQQKHVVHSTADLHQLVITTMSRLPILSMVTGHFVHSIPYHRAAVRFFQSLPKADLKTVQSAQPITAYFQSYSWLYRLLKGSGVMELPMRSFIEEFNTNERKAFARACSYLVAQTLSCTMTSQGGLRVAHSRDRRNTDDQPKCMFMPPQCVVPEQNVVASDIPGVQVITDLVSQDVNSQLAHNTTIQHNKQAFEAVGSIMTPDMLQYESGLLQMVLRSNVYDKRDTKFWFVKEVMDRDMTETELVQLFSGEEDDIPHTLYNFSIPQIAAIFVRKRLNPRLQAPTTGSRAMIVDGIPTPMWSRNTTIASEDGYESPPAQDMPESFLLSEPARQHLSGSTTYRRWFASLYSQSWFRIPILIIVPDAQHFVRWFSRQPRAVTLRTVFDPYSWSRVSSPLVSDDYEHYTLGTVSAVYALDEAAWTATETYHGLKFTKYDTYKESVRGTYVSFHPDTSGTRYQAFLGALPVQVKYHMFK